jgi:hypothetical protein
LSTARPPLASIAPHRAAGPAGGRIAAICRQGDLIAAGLLALIVGALLLPAAIRLPLAIPLGYNEGWNAYQALRVIAGQPLYPRFGDLIANNYPPLSFYLIGWLGMIFGDHIVIGRTIALVSLLLVACNIGLIVRSLGGSARLAAFGALLFLGYMVAQASAYVGTNDPQLLAQLVMTTALLLFLRGRRSSLGVAATAALALLSGLIKHSLIPLPLAITVWLWWHDRRAFAVWLATSAALLLGCGALLYVIYGQDFFLGVFATPRAYGLGNLISRMPVLLLPALPMLGASLLLLAAEPRCAEVWLLALYGLFAGVWVILILPGEGVDVNAVFDLVICAAIAAALAVERLPALAPGPVMLRTAGMVVLMLPILVLAPSRLVREISSLKHLDGQRAEVADGIRYIAARHGPVACEDLALCYWAGKDFEVDFFTSGQKLAMGVIDADRFARGLRDHRFAALQVCGRGGASFSRRLPGDVDRVLGESYRVARSGPTVGLILVPGSAADGSKIDPEAVAGQGGDWAC